MTTLYFDTPAPLALFAPVARDTIRQAGGAPPPTEPPSPSPSWRRRLAQWLETRAARRRLLRYAELDPRLAADIGLTPGDLAVERLLPFWVPVRRR